MSSFEEQVSDYIRALHGTNRENAYHRLIELGGAVIPLLERGFKAESDTFIRSVLVKVAWSTNSARAIPLLADALDDGEPDVWKEALDGLISLGGRGALDVVRQARARAGNNKSEWLDEAIQQIVDSLSST